MYVLRRLREALVTDGIILDLQVIRPDPLVESKGQVVCEIDGSSLFVGADAARGAVDLLVHERLLVEEAVDDHEVLKHYDNGDELVDDFSGKQRTLPPQMVPMVRALRQECVVRERCRLRRLRRVRISTR